jgi:hypothetical protein
MTDKLIALLKADTDTALKANVKAMEANVNNMTRATDIVMKYNTKLKNILDKRIKEYNSSVNQLFVLDGWRQKVFWAGIAGGILTPIFLIISHFL